MRHFLIPLMALALSACQLTEGSFPLNSRMAAERDVVTNDITCEWPTRIIVRGGTMAFYGEQASYWPEQIALCDGQVKRVTFYEMRQGLKTKDHSKTLTVALVDGLLLFDANPYRLNVVNHGARIPLNYSSTQRISNLTLTENFSISKARNISIIIKQPQQGY